MLLQTGMLLPDMLLPEMSSAFLWQISEKIVLARTNGKFQISKWMLPSFKQSHMELR